MAGIVNFLKRLSSVAFPDPAPTEVKKARIEVLEGPFKDLLLELKIEIFKLLPGNDVDSCRRVCREWKNLISSTPTNPPLLLLKKINVALAKAMLPKQENHEILLEAIKVEATFDIEEAKRSLQKAFSAARRGHVKNRFPALLEVIKVEATIDPEGAKRTLQEAVSSARAIEYPDMRSQALLKVAKIQATIDTDGAKRTAQEIENSYYRYKVLLEVAKEEANFDREEAKRTLQEAASAAQAMGDSYNRYEAPYEVFKVEAKIDPEEAKRTALAIENPGKRFEALFEVAKIQASIYPVEAKRTALAIEHPGGRS